MQGQTCGSPVPSSTLETDPPPLNPLQSTAPAYSPHRTFPLLPSIAISKPGEWRLAPICVYTWGGGGFLMMTPKANAKGKTRFDCMYSLIGESPFLNSSLGFLGAPDGGDSYIRRMPFLLHGGVTARRRRSKFMIIFPPLFSAHMGAYPPPPPFAKCNNIAPNAAEEGGRGGPSQSNIAGIGDV